MLKTLKLSRRRTYFSADELPFSRIYNHGVVDTNGGCDDRRTCR
ncbi:hypothetical protein BIFPSEUDO_04212 [Bifidobacterium pseudocatenulatum DSM 20438 = JCM 1200 = LMG 10505]|uniref:Uncharacterized protein n=1 Tax=Bifidobacterium pseudocatenulatum DSM 20438 = JCM 1200 = LMG 10505 TaxID=547043 RepID=C0BUX3_BIFPS|nr:hypothetical protein BIFPSEUDO_04212 [Bifidobacterium pseudocatenulatum DSM 20438 = JCM 1200 = LMG 10505]